MAKYNKLPLDFNGITGSWEEHVERGSRGQDFGYFDYQGEPVYAINDGTVDQVDYNDSCGNYIWIKHEYDDQHDLWSRYLHLKDGTTKVSVGQKVSRYQQIANMGNTGSSTATHLHFEVWFVPKGWAFNWNDRNKYAVRGTDYCYLFDGQTVANDTRALVIRVLGTNNQVARDTSKDQIEVFELFLRCRADAGTDKEVYGYIDTGFYNYDATKEANGYTWYHVPAGWIAGTEEDTKVYPKQNPTPPTPIPDDKDKKNAELQKQVSDLQETIKKQDTDLLAQKSLIEEQTKKIEELNDLLSKYSNLKTFKALNKGLYYICLKKNEKVYY